MDAEVSALVGWILDRGRKTRPQNRQGELLVGWAQGRWGDNMLHGGTLLLCAITVRFRRE